MGFVLKKEVLYLNREKFNKEMELHKGEVHPKTIHNGHHAKLDRQSDIAAILHVSRSTLGNWLNRSNSIAEYHLKALANMFGCDWEYLCDKQEYRSKKEYMISILEKARDDIQHTHDNNEPWFEFFEFEDDHTITCNKYPVKRLIREIVQLGGYELIIEGLKDISDLIKA